MRPFLNASMIIIVTGICWQFACSTLKYTFMIRAILCFLRHPELAHRRCRLHGQSIEIMRVLAT